MLAVNNLDPARAPLLLPLHFTAWQRRRRAVAAMLSVQRCAAQGPTPETRSTLM